MEAGERGQGTHRYMGFRPLGRKNLRGTMGPRVRVEAGLWGMMESRAELRRFVKRDRVVGSDELRKG